MSKKQILVFSKDNKGTYYYETRQIAKVVDLLIISEMLDRKLIKEFDIRREDLDSIKQRTYNTLYEE